MKFNIVTEREQKKRKKEYISAHTYTDRHYQCQQFMQKFSASQHKLGVVLAMTLSHNILRQQT